MADGEGSRVTITGGTLRNVVLRAVAGGVIEVDGAAVGDRVVRDDSGGGTIVWNPR